MLAAQTISVFLNNALKATPQLAELDCESPLPEAVREMPEEIHGHFVEVDPTLAHEMEAAWKRVMMLNSTHVLYTFRYEAASGNFVATKR
jgi:hypothetical protein